MSMKAASTWYIEAFLVVRSACFTKKPVNASNPVSVMKKILLLAALAAFFVSCTRLETRYVCTCQQLDEVQDFIKETIEPANNFSDEEMEDVVRQLWATGVKTTCNQRLFRIIPLEHRIDWSKSQVDSCETVYEYVP